MKAQRKGGSTTLNNKLRSKELETDLDLQFDVAFEQLNLMFWNQLGQCHQESDLQSLHSMILSSIAVLKEGSRKRVRKAQGKEKGKEK